MTASHGLRSDSHDVVYSEDVVTYADPQDVADGTSDAYGVCVGLVSRVAGDDAEDEDEWEDDEDEPVPDDHAEVCWLRADGTRVVPEPNARLRVIDRAFIHGDVVARAANALGTQGSVIAVNVDVDLQFADGTRAHGVSTRRLTQVRHYRPGHYVVHPGLGGWVGRIEEVHDDVHVRFEDGSECVVHDPDVERLIPAEDSSLFPDEEQCAYFPGLVVHASTSVLRGAKWIRGKRSQLGRTRLLHNSNRTHTGVVSEVSPGQLVVDWIHQRDVYDADGTRVTSPPPETIGVDGLWALTFFAHTCWQLGDRCVVDSLADRRAADPYVDDLESYLPNDEGSVYECEESVDDIQARHRRCDETLHEMTLNGVEHGPAGAVNRGTAAAFAAGKYDQDGGVNAGSNGAGSGSARGTWGARRRNARRGRADASNARAPNGVTGGQTDAANVNDEAAEEDEEGLSVPASPSPPPPIHPCAIIIATRTFVDVHWQDGSVTHRVPSRDLVPITHGGEHDFLPGQFVSRRSEDDDVNPNHDSAPTTNHADQALADAEYLENAMARYGRLMDEGPFSAEDLGVEDDGEMARATAFGRDLIVGTIERLRARADEEAPEGDANDIARALGSTAIDMASDNRVGAEAARVSFQHRLRQAQAALYHANPTGVPEGSTGPPAGVVVSVDASERIARVRWLDPELVGGDYTLDEGTIGKEEDVSVYELREHDAFPFRLGDVVMKLPEVTEVHEANIAALHEVLRVGTQTIIPGEAAASRDPLAPDEKFYYSDLDADSASESEYESVNDSDEPSGDYPEAVDYPSDDDDEDEDEGDWDRIQDSPHTGFSVERNSATGRVRVVPSVDSKTLTWVGEVVGVTDGRVRVAWGDGTIAEAIPSDLYIVNGDDLDAGDGLGPEELGSLLDGDEFDDGYGSQGSQWETDGEDEDEDEDGDGPSSDRGMPTAAAARAMPMPGSQTGIATGMGARLPATMDPAALAWVSLRAEEAERSWLTEHQRNAAAADNAVPQTPMETQTPAGATNVSRPSRPIAQLSKEDAARAAEAIAAAFKNVGSGGGAGSGGAIGANQLAAALGAAVGAAPARTVPSDQISQEGVQKNEECVQKNEEGVRMNEEGVRMNEDGHARFESIAGDSGSDHFYHGEQTTVSSDRKWTKRVSKEWAVLKAAIPDTVWCRVYEDRMDLCRAVLVGPSGTPYHDNLFVFDFHFTPAYPAEPPKAHYHSFGQRVNPNLYESGKVCLSLLHTWQGKGSEVWSPENSNMLQVLVSIQGLVLVEKAYYNEAGYEKQVGSDEGERNNAQYAEQAFLASLKTMLGLLKNPPRHCESLIRDHFKHRADAILCAIDAYIHSGCPVGAYVHPKQGGAEGGAEGGEIKPSPAQLCSNKTPPSAGFKLALGGMRGKVAKALEDVGRRGPFGPPPFA